MVQCELVHALVAALHAVDVITTAFHVHPTEEWKTLQLCKCLIVQITLLYRPPTCWGYLCTVKPKTNTQSYLYSPHSLDRRKRQPCFRQAWIQLSHCPTEDLMVWPAALDNSEELDSMRSVPWLPLQSMPAMKAVQRDWLQQHLSHSTHSKLHCVTSVDENCIKHTLTTLEPEIQVTLPK